MRQTLACARPYAQGSDVCGGNRIRTYEVIRQQIYSLSQLAALVFPRLINVSLNDPVFQRLRYASQKTGVQNYTVFHFFKT
jgi:hypothetical protein